MPFEPMPIERQIDPTAADMKTLVEMGVVEPQPEPENKPPTERNLAPPPHNAA